MSAIFGSSSDICPAYVIRFGDQFASRTTILNILDEGVKGNFLTKKMDHNDHRKQNYHLNIESEKIISNWLDHHPFHKKNDE